MEGVDDDFLRRVQFEYDRYSTLSKAETSTQELKGHFRGTRMGCFFVPMLYLLDPLSKRALEKERQRHRFRDFELKADALIAEESIRTEICTTLYNFPKTEIVTDDALLRVVSDVLRIPRLVRNFDIPADPALFAMVAYRIVAKGLQSYCDRAQN